MSKYSRIWYRWKDNLTQMKIHIRNMVWKCFVRTRHGLKGCHVTKAVIAPMSGSQTPISKKVRQKRVYSCFLLFWIHLTLLSSDKNSGGPPLLGKLFYDPFWAPQGSNGGQKGQKLPISPQMMIGSYKFGYICYFG